VQISWGKIKLDAPRVKVHGDASLLLPLLVARAFATPLDDDKKQ
jgi:deoxyhypusine synthase